MAEKNEAAEVSKTEIDNGNEQVVAVAAQQMASTAAQEMVITKKLYELKYKIPPVNLHYDSLQPNANINVDHVNKILGYKVKSCAEKMELVKQWTSWKNEVCGCASHHIKK